MTERSEEASSDFVAPVLVDLRLRAGIWIGCLVAISAGGLTEAILVGESDGWAIAVFVATALLNAILHLRKRGRLFPPDVNDLVVAPASAHVEPMSGTCLRELPLASLVAVGTLSIVLFYPVIGAVLAGWLTGDLAAHILGLLQLRRWEATHGKHLRGVREKGLRSLRSPQEVMAQNRYPVMAGR